MRRFHTLDAVRGVAALTVFSGHAGSYTEPFQLTHFTLSVDLFFMLSGYVLSHAYLHRLSHDMTTADFLITRWIRLYPLYILGALIGIAGALIALLAGEGTYTLQSFLIASIFTILMAPSPTWNAHIYLMPMNMPAWSLAYEMLANFLFALTARFLTTGRLLAICGVFAIWLAQVGLSHGGLHDGYDWLLGWIGLPRVMFGFFAGVTVQRLVKPRHIVTRWAYLMPLAILPLLSDIGGSLGDIVKTIIIFPIFIAVAASVEPPKTRLFNALGLMSYPLYMIHMPIIQNIDRALTVLHIDKAMTGPTLGLVLGAGLVVIALALDRAYDRPARRWLDTRILRAVRKTEAVTIQP